jgi:hypothetical protein
MADNSPPSALPHGSSAADKPTLELREMAALTNQMARQQNEIDALFSDQLADLCNQITYQTELTLQLDQESAMRLHMMAELTTHVVQMNHTLQQLLQRVADLEQAMQRKHSDE